MFDKTMLSLKFENEKVSLQNFLLVISINITGTYIHKTHTHTHTSNKNKARANMHIYTHYGHLPIYISFASTFKICLML